MSVHHDFLAHSCRYSLILLLLLRGFRLNLTVWLLDAILGVSETLATYSSRHLYRWGIIFYHQHRLAHLPVVYNQVRLLSQPRHCDALVPFVCVLNNICGALALRSCGPYVQLGSPQNTPVLISNDVVLVRLVTQTQAHKFHHYLHDTTAFDAHIYGAGAPEEWFSLVLEAGMALWFGLYPAALSLTLIMQSVSSKVGHTRTVGAWTRPHA